MAYFSVTYQLNKKKDYKQLWDAFEDLGAFKPMRDFYLIEANTTTEGLSDYLTQFIDGDDFLFVCKLDSRPFKYKCLQGTQAWVDARF